MRILHVTREIGSDRRYGIGRSLAPVVQALQARGHEVRYLTQDDQSPRGRAWQQRWTERLGRWGERLAGAPGRVLAAVWIERLDMGRLAEIGQDQALVSAAGLDLAQVAGNMTTSISATDLALDFFEAHPRTG